MYEVIKRLAAFGLVESLRPCRDQSSNAGEGVEHRGQPVRVLHLGGGHLFTIINRR